MNLARKTAACCLAVVLAAFTQAHTSRADSIISDATLSVTLTEQGAVKAMTWHRPGAGPVDFTFRHDRYEGFCWHVNVAGNWRVKLPLSRVQPGSNAFAAKEDGIVYSLEYAVREGRLEVIAGISNETSRVFAPDRVLVNVGLDTEMAKFPEWNERFFPTLLRCEETHFWGYFMRPDGVILGIASPDPVRSWAHGYNSGGHRLYTSSLDLLNAAPQPDRHPDVPQTLAPGESRRWRVYLAPLDTLAEVQPSLARAAGIPMIVLDRPTVESGQSVEGAVTAPVPVTSLAVAGPDGKSVPCELRGGRFSFPPSQPGLYTITLRTDDGKVAEAKASCRMPWSWYLKQARANAVAKPQKASSHTESWYGLFSGYLAACHFPDAALDTAIEAKYAEIAPLMYDLDKMLPTSWADRIQNHACWASMLVDRYEATGDRRSLEFAAALADFLLTKQTPDGAYRNQKTRYTCVVYIAKSILEVMAAEEPLAANDPAWKARYDRHADSVRRAIDELEGHLDNVETEGEPTYEDGMIACSYTQLALYALHQSDPAQRQKYAAAARKVAAGHRCLSQIVIPDSRMNGGSLRYWESQYDILATPNMMSSPHGWSAWRLYGLWYLYQLTGEKEYLRQAMNGLGSCVQLIDFKTGDLRWGFVADPCIQARVFEQDPANPGKGAWKPRLVGEQYLPMISGWYRAPAHTWVVGYFGMDTKLEGGCCDNDVHEIFKCLAEIALDSAYVVENADGSLEAWNGTARRNGRGVIEVTPAEAVVSRVHFNLKKPAEVAVVFAAGKQAGTIKEMGWFSAGGRGKI